MTRQLIVLAVVVLALLPAGAVAAQPDVGDDPDDEVLVRVNGSQHIGPEEHLGVVVIVRGDLVVEGRVDNTLVVVDGDAAFLRGSQVDGTVVIVEGTLTLRDGSNTSADIHLGGDSSWIREEGAILSGEVRDDEFDIGSSTAWSIILVTMIGWLGTTLILVVAAIVFAGIGGRQLRGSALNVTRRPGATVLAALAFWLGLALLAVPLLLSGIGALALPVMFATGLAVWFLGVIVFATRIGAIVTGRDLDDPEVNHPYGPAIAGTLVLQVLLLLAVGGLLASLLVALFADDAGPAGLLLGIPTFIVYVLLWLVGIVGGGALVLRAMAAWTNGTGEPRAV
jgi:hypothetical protein